jgi:hypothetical protein
MRGTDQAAVVGIESGIILSGPRIIPLFNIENRENILIETRITGHQMQTQKRLYQCINKYNRID